MKKYFYLLVLAMMPMCLTSCGADDDSHSALDPEGTVTVKFTHSGDGSSLTLFDNTYATIIHGRMRDYYNSFGSSYAYLFFADCGEADGLGEIRSIPSSGWSRNVPIVEGHGYVIRYSDTDRTHFTYARLYVAKHYDEYDLLKYQVPFSPGE